VTGQRINPLGEGGPQEAEVVLLPERAVWWPAAKTLLVADLHLGKCETMRVNGAPMTAAALGADLLRLATVIRRTEATRVLVLGDLLHARAGVTSALIDGVAEWRKHAVRGVEIVVVTGNHDGRIGAVASAWQLTVAGSSFREGLFEFRHDPEGPEASEGGYVWAGHLHPLARVEGPRDSLRLPCFWLGERVGVLPAFGAFTGGVTMARGEKDRVFALADGCVVAL
jgi:hypothetical protein